MSGDLSLDWPAGQGVFQGINMDFIGSCNLGEVRTKEKTASVSHCVAQSQQDSGSIMAAATIMTA